MSPFRAIHTMATGLSTTRACSLLNVSRSGFYAWRDRKPSQRQRVDERLGVRLRAQHEQHKQRCGSRRHVALMAEEGGQNLAIDPLPKVGRRRVRRLMREEGLVAVQTRRFRKTTQSDHGRGYSPDLLKREFYCEQPNEAWVGDITYVWTAEGWCFLAILLDLYARRIVGWAMGDHMRVELPLKALGRALETRQPTPGLIVHSDRGSQYASKAYRDRIRDAEACQSMGDAGTAYDNAVAESFFRTLKGECLDRQPFSSRTEAYDAVSQYIDGYYNPIRPHSTLGYRSPLQYEQAQRTTRVA